MFVLVPFVSPSKGGSSPPSRMSPRVGTCVCPAILGQGPSNLRVRRHLATRTVAMFYWLALSDGRMGEGVFGRSPWFSRFW